MLNNTHYCVCGLRSFQFFSIPWTVAHLAPLNMEFSKQEYGSGFPLPTPEDLPDWGIKTVSLASLVLAGRFFTTVTTGKPSLIIQFSSVQFSRTWITVRQASLSITKSRSLLKLMSIELVMPSSHPILCRPLLLPPVSPSIRVFSNESTLCKVLEFQLQYQSFQWTPRTDLL